MEQAQAITDGELAWAADQIATFLQSAVSVVDAARLPSRVAAVVRLVVSADGTERRFFLKRLPSVTQGDLLLLFDRLRAIAEVFARRDGLTPYRVVACDPDRRLWLTADVEGRPLGSMHAAAAWNPRLRARTLAAWQRLGTWMSTLHWDSLPPMRSRTYADEMVAYCEERFVAWAREDRNHESLARQAIEVTRAVGADLAGDDVDLTPCHGDVTSYNIIVDSGIGMIDFDDFHYGLPAVDISQAVLEIEQYSWLARAVRLPGYQRAATDRFFAGYSRPVPQGGRFWLPHLRNLSVFVPTLARRQKGRFSETVLESLYYARMRQELRDTVDAILAGRDSADYLRRAQTKTRVAR